MRHQIPVTVNLPEQAEEEIHSASDAEISIEESVDNSQPPDMPAGDNTATPEAYQNQQGTPGGDENILMQNVERLYMDDGSTGRSDARMTRCIQESLAWLEPVRLRPEEMRRRWLAIQTNRLCPRPLPKIRNGSSLFQD